MCMLIMFRVFCIWFVEEQAGSVSAKSIVAYALNIWTIVSRRAISCADSAAISGYSATRSSVDGCQFKQT